MMDCPQCGTENRGASNFCRFCGYNLAASEAQPDSGYVPSVPPPEATEFKSAYPPEAYQEPPPTYVQPQPQPVYVQPPPTLYQAAPGQYQPTPPNFPKPAFTHWSRVTPFALRRADQFRPGLPPSLASDAYSDAFDEVKSLGIQNSTTRTADQTVIGRFWGGAIQNYWNEIAQTARAERLRRAHLHRFVRHSLG